MRAWVGLLFLGGCAAPIHIERPPENANRPPPATVALYQFDTDASESRQASVENMVLTGCLQAVVDAGKRPVDATHVRIARPKPTKDEWPRLFQKLGPRCGSDAFIRGSLIVSRNSQSIAQAEAFLVAPDGAVLASATIDTVDESPAFDTGRRICSGLLGGAVKP